MWLAWGSQEKDSRVESPEPAVSSLHLPLLSSPLAVPPAEEEVRGERGGEVGMCLVFPV